METALRTAAMSLSRTSTLPSTRSRYTEPSAAIPGTAPVSWAEGWGKVGWGGRKGHDVQ